MRHSLRRECIAWRCSTGFDQRIDIFHSLPLESRHTSTPPSSLLSLPAISVLRQAKPPSTSAFHRPPLTSQPALQAALLALLHRLIPPDTAALFPAPLFCSPSASPFLVESFLPGCDLSSLLPLPPSVLQPLMTRVGRCLRQLHSIPCSLYGRICAIRGDCPVGSLPSWASAFSSFVSRVQACGVSPTLTSSLLQLHEAQMPFLASFQQLEDVREAARLKAIEDEEEDAEVKAGRGKRSSGGSSKATAGKAHDELRRMR